MSIIESEPARFAVRCSGHTGSERHPDLGWPAVGYVCHVADNFRIWAERLVGIVRSGLGEVTPYDENELADARRYEGIRLAGALWSLEVAAPNLLFAIGAADRASAVLIHPERGTQSVTDVSRSIADDAVHHEWDLDRIFAATAGR